MKWLSIVTVSAVVGFMFLYEWPKINRNQKKEKAAFAALAALGWLLAVLLVYYPNMPGPTQLVEMIYKPLFGNILE